MSTLNELKCFGIDENDHGKFYVFSVTEAEARDIETWLGLPLDYCDSPERILQGIRKLRNEYETLIAELEAELEKRAQAVHNAAQATWELCEILKRRFPEEALEIRRVQEASLPEDRLLESTERQAFDAAALNMLLW